MEVFKLKKLTTIITLCFFIMLLLFPQKALALSVSARYACVIDALSGNILYEKNAHTKHSMASTTKIMTALVALENADLSDIVKVSSNAAGTEGSSIYLRQNEEIPLSDLLYGLMLASGNDAAVAIAEHVGKTKDGFAKMMNDKAKELGLKNTSFKNPNGLDEEGHYTTAYELALITKEALKNDTFREIVSTKTKNISNGNESYMRSLTNHNKLLGMYDGCIGVKTGYTKKTGRCLVSSAERDGFRVIAVTLNAPDDWNDHIRMLNYAFENCERKPVIIKDMILKTIPVENGDKDRLELLASDNLYVTLTGKDDISQIELLYKSPSSICAPVTKGSVLGSISVYYKDEKLGETELLAGCDISYQEPPKLTFDNIFIRLFTALCLNAFNA